MKDPLKIAFAMINCNRRDGSARAVNEVAERLAERGNEVHLYARKADDLDLDKVKWHPVPGPSWPEAADFLSYYWLTNWRLRNSDYDIIHSIGCNTLRANVVTIQNIQPAKRPILEKFRAAEKVSIFRRFTRNLYLDVTTQAEKKLYTRRSDRTGPAFLPVSRGVESELRAHYDIGDAPVWIIPNAADTELFQPIAVNERLAWRRAEGLSAEDFVCIFTGGEWARKGLDLAIHAIGQLPDARLKLFVAGTDPDAARFKTMAEQLAPGRVHFGGFRRDVAKAMASADVFLFPSHYEAFSLAILEAAACALPILATRINGSEDFIEPGVNGAFILPEASDIARAITAIRQDPAALARMGANARERVETQFTWDRVTTLTEAAYRQVMAAQPRRPRDHQ